MRIGLILLLLLAMLLICACAVPATGPWRTVVEQPTRPQGTMSVDYAPFDANRTLKYCNVIFRGKYQGGRDIRVSWKTRDGSTRDADISVHAINVLDVLYGTLPDPNTVRAVSHVSWEIGELDIRLEPGGEYYFLGRVFTDEDRQLPQENPDNQLRLFELGDVYLSSIAFETMPVSNGIVRYWREWPLQGAALATEHPTTLSEGVITMSRLDFEQKFLDMVRQMQGEATPEPSATR